MGRDVRAWRWGGVGRFTEKNFPFRSTKGGKSIAKKTEGKGRETRVSRRQAVCTEKRRGVFRPDRPQTVQKREPQLRSAKNEWFASVPKGLGGVAEDKRGCPENRLEVDEGKTEGGRNSTARTERKED